MRFQNVMFTVAAIALAAAAQVPNFSDHPVEQVFKGQAAKPVLITPFQKRFRTQIRHQATSPPNFAGHYRIVQWGCGSSCVSIVIVDLETGAVYSPPFSVLGYAAPYKYEGGDDELEYRVSSGLLVARGCPEDKNCGTYYYVWKADHLGQVRFVPHGPLP